MNNGNGQKLITIPKSSKLTDGDFVIVKRFIHPMKQKLEKFKKENVKVQIILKGKKETRQGKITGFIYQGVMLDSGCFIEFDAIGFINEIYPEDCRQEEEELFESSSPTQQINEEEAELLQQNRDAELETE